MTGNALSYEIGNVVEVDMLDGTRVVRVTEKRDPSSEDNPAFLAFLSPHLVLTIASSAMTYGDMTARSSRCEERTPTYGKPNGSKWE